MNELCEVVLCKPQTAELQAQPSIGGRGKGGGRRTAVKSYMYMYVCCTSVEYEFNQTKAQMMTHFNHVGQSCLATCVP